MKKGRMFAHPPRFLCRKESLFSLFLFALLGAGLLGGQFGFLEGDFVVGFFGDGDFGGQCSLGGFGGSLFFSQSGRGQNGSALLELNFGFGIRTGDIDLDGHFDFRVQMHNFVSRDGVTPDEFRRVAREQLSQYPNVVVKDVRVGGVTGAKGEFDVAVGADTVKARRVLLCTGMIDEQLPIDGFRDLWGHAVVQCPYCHGWESKGRPWGYLVRSEHAAHLQMFALQLRSWTDEVCVFTNGEFEVPPAVQSQLVAAGLRLETARITRLVAREHHLEAVELSDGRRVECELLFAHPPQHQVEMVRTLAVTLDAEGFVQVDPMSRQTSVPGVFAAGDLTTRLQAAIAAASSGMQAAAMINFELAMELASARAP